MTQEPGPAEEAGILMPSVPWDIAVRSQRGRILSAMAKSSAEKTFAATTIADIVGHASISRATFYKHFTNKAECFHAATEDFLVELREVVSAVRSGVAESGSEEIREVTAALLERLAAKPDQAKLLLVEAPTVDPEIVMRYREMAMNALETELSRSGRRSTRNGADPEIAFGRAKVIVADYVAAGKTAQLPTLLPELLYIALLPYVGQVAALELAKISG